MDHVAAFMLVIGIHVNAFGLIVCAETSEIKRGTRVVPTRFAESWEGFQQAVGEWQLVGFRYASLC